MAEDAAIELHRDAVIELCKPGHALAPDSGSATVNNPAWFRSRSGQLQPTGRRALLHESILAESRAAAPEALNERKAIIMAGPPGAGKGYVRDEVLGDSRKNYLVIDADEFKAALLRQAMADGSYESWIKPESVKEREAAGESFFPMELASLVHEESSQLAQEQRRAAISQGTNIIVDTVLSSEESARKLGEQLAAANYVIEVIDVEVPFGVSQQRIVQRWQETYEEALSGKSDLGGRWVPSEYARDVFDGPEGRSKPSFVSEQLAKECPAVMRHRAYWTSSEEAAKPKATAVVVQDLKRNIAGGPLLDSKLAVVHQRVAASRPGGTVERGSDGPGIGS